MDSQRKARSFDTDPSLKEKARKTGNSLAETKEKLKKRKNLLTKAREKTTPRNPIDTPSMDTDCRTSFAFFHNLQEQQEKKKKEDRSSEEREIPAQVLSKINCGMANRKRSLQIAASRVLLDNYPPPPKKKKVPEESAFVRKHLMFLGLA